ncbi:MAG: CopD family protein [Actinobacteria bacterium]|nr:CopD family protein [Actinomycetota bacterium]
MPLQDTFQSIAFSVTRFTGFTANAIIIGLVPICILVLRPAFAGLDPGDWRDGKKRLATRLEDLVQAALVASATATVIGILLQLAILAGAEGQITGESFTTLASTPFGRAYLVRLPLLAGLTVLLLNRVRDSALAGAGDGETMPSTAWWATWVGLGTLLLATTSFSGHAAVGRPRVLSIGNDVVHLLSGAVWFSGIIVLSTLVPYAWRQVSESDRVELLAPLVIRFSKVALISITIVAVTGVVNSLFDVARLRDLVESGYGITLSVKLVLFVGVLALGAVNHRYVRTRLERRDRVGRVARLFRRLIVVELAIGLTIMGVTGVLTGMQKTRESGGGSSVTARPTL